MVGSGPLTPEGGFTLWASFHYDYGAYTGDEPEAWKAFAAGYELATSQSTQGSGEWDPQE